MNRLSSKPRELRRHRRFAVDAGTLQVSWLDLTGKMKITRTRALNISEDGIALQLPEAAMPLLVRFRSERFKLQGAGSVKYCRRAGGLYVVGLEFAEGLHWRSPAGEVREPIPFCDPEADY